MNEGEFVTIKEDTIPLPDNVREYIYAENRAILSLTKDFLFYSKHDKPNWWWRLWQYLLLGWKWEDIDDKN